MNSKKLNLSCQNPNFYLNWQSRVGIEFLERKLFVGIDFQYKCQITVCKKYSPSCPSFWPPPCPSATPLMPPPPSLLLLLSPPPLSSTPPQLPQPCRVASKAITWLMYQKDKKGGGVTEGDGTKELKNNISLKLFTVLINICLPFLRCTVLM